MGIKYYDYNELKEILVIKEEIKTKLREHNEIESEKLRKGLLYHKRILTPLEVHLSWGGLVLVCGHHRWNMLPEIITECPDFDLNIPVVFIEAKDVQERIIDEQLGRRNLSNEDIKQYVEVLITEKGLSKNKAYKEVSEKTGFSKSKVKRIVQPELAEAHRASQKIRDTTKKLSQMNNFSPVSIETSSKTKKSSLTSPLEPLTNKVEVKEKTEKEICEELLLELHTLAVKLSYRPSLQEYSNSLYDIYDQIEIKLK